MRVLNSLFQFTVPSRSVEVLSEEVSDEKQTV